MRWCASHRQPLFEAPPTAVATYVVEQLERHARATAMNRLLAIRSFYRYLIREGVRHDDPTSGMKVRRDRLLPRRPFDDDEIAALLSACQSPRDQTIIRFLLSSGCRRDEAARLRSDDIDWTRGRVLVHGKGRKERWVAPGPTTMAALKALAARNGHGSLFGLSGHGIYLMLRRRAKEAGVPHVGAHRFRVTFAVRFLQERDNIAALKEILGHADISMTEHYASFGMAERALSLQSGLDFGSI